MADRVRLNLDQGRNAKQRMDNEADKVERYINSTVNSAIVNLRSWWIGNAADAFHEDWQKTKQEFMKNIHTEIKIYSNNLMKAVQAQHEQDVANARTVRVN